MEEIYNSIGAILIISFGFVIVLGIILIGLDDRIEDFEYKLMKLLKNNIFTRIIYFIIRLRLFNINKLYVTEQCLINELELKERIFFKIKNDNINEYNMISKKFNIYLETKFKLNIKKEDLISCVDMYNYNKSIKIVNKFNI